MSERCNLKTLTAALCCFYHKNSVITAKVRQTRVWGCVQYSQPMLLVYFGEILNRKHIC